MTVERLFVAYFTVLPLLCAIGLVLPFSVLMIGGTARLRHMRRSRLLTRHGALCRMHSVER